VIVDNLGGTDDPAGRHLRGRPRRALAGPLPRVRCRAPMARRRSAEGWSVVGRAQSPASHRRRRTLVCGRAQHGPPSHDLILVDGGAARRALSGPEDYRTALVHCEPAGRPGLLPRLVPRRTALAPCREVGRLDRTRSCRQVPHHTEDSSSVRGVRQAGPVSADLPLVYRPLTSYGQAPTAAVVRCSCLPPGMVSHGHER
jgi:hypothetical protein